MTGFPPWWRSPNCDIIQYNRNKYKTSLTFVALRDSPPLAGLIRVASLSSKSSSSESLTWITRFLLNFFDLDFKKSDRATATPFSEVVQDFAEVEAWDTMALLLVPMLSDWDDLEWGPSLADLLVKVEFLLLDWWEDLVVTSNNWSSEDARSSFYI